MSTQLQKAKLVKYTYRMLRPPKLLSVSQWSDANRILVSEGSAEPGRWRTDRAPYQREIMDAFTQPGVWQIVIMASAQCGKTEMEINMMGRAIDVDPGPILFIQPSDGFAEDFSKRRVAPMIRACPVLRSKVYEARSRDAGNTITMKVFPGGSVAFTGANSPTELAGRPVRYIFMDEIDRFPASAGTEGNPIKLAEKRSETFRHNRKIVKTSTPTIKGFSNIERAYAVGTQEEWHTQCPHCGEFSYIRFQNIEFRKEEYTDEANERQYRVSDVRWKCPFCNGETDEYTAKRCPAKWVSKNPQALDNGIRSFRLNAFMSPWSDWPSIALEFLNAHDDPELLKVFFNTVLGETWELKDRSGAPESMLSRREVYEAEVPSGVLILTMGVDTQDNRLEYEVVGWGRDEQSWGIEKGVIPGRADESKVWEGLDDLLDREWKLASGMKLRILATFMDSGGHFTQEVYRECAKRESRHVWAVKGEGGDKPYVRPMKRNTEASKAMRFIVGVDSGKEAIMYSASLPEPGPKYMHFPKQRECGYDIEFFRGLLSEKMVLHRKQGRQTISWEKIYERNEPLDCRNYARAAFRYFNWNFDKIERMLAGIEESPVEKRRAAQQKHRNRVLSRGVQV